jgi:hypothetical protein
MIVDLIEVELRIVPQSARLYDATRAIELKTARRITLSHRTGSSRNSKMAFIDGISRREDVDSGQLELRRR